MYGPSNNTENAFSQFETAAKLNLERPNYDTDKWRYESSCAHYGMALVMARLSSRIGHGCREDASEQLQKAAHIVPSGMAPDLTLEQLMFIARGHPSDPSWGFATPPDPYR